MERRGLRDERFSSRAFERWALGRGDTTLPDAPGTIHISRAVNGYTSSRRTVRIEAKGGVSIGHVAENTLNQQVLSPNICWPSG
jgi:hypothetical protein